MLSQAGKQQNTRLLGINDSSESRKINAEIAARLIGDSFSGVRRRLEQRTQFALSCMKWHSKLLRVEQVLAVLLMLMSFLESPAWCANPDTVNCTDAHYPNSQAPYISKGQGLLFEGIVLFVVISDLVLRMFAYGREFVLYKATKEGYSVDKMHLFQVLLISVYVLDYIKAACASTMSGFRLALFLRLGLVYYLVPSLRQEERLVLMIVPKFLKTMVMVCFLILLYASFGVALFEGEDEGTQHFPTVEEGMWSLMVLLTTANYPDVMMPIYSSYRVTSLYFISFLLIGLFFLMNLLLAQVYSSYEEEKEIMFNELEENCRANLEKAFDIMTECQKPKPLWERELSIEEITSIFMELKATHGISHISEEEAKAKFQKLDKDGSNTIDLEEFYYFVEVVQHTFVVEDPSFLERRCPGVYNSVWFYRLKQCIESQAFEYFIDFCLLLNGILAMYEIHHEEGVILSLLNDGRMDTWIEVCEFSFTIVYSVEMILKVFVMGFLNYAKSFKNVFDGVVTVMGITAAAFVYCPNSFSDSRVLRYVLLCRFMRLARLVTNLRVFREISETFVNVLPVAKRLLFSLFCILYLFACLGMQLFGGKINTDPDSRYSALLLGTEYDEENYYANNFNDLASGMVTLFELLVVNNWQIIVDGFVAVSSRYSRLFFILFYCVGVLIRLNLVVAFILDSYDKMQAEKRKEAWIEERTTEYSFKSPMPNVKRMMEHDVEERRRSDSAFEDTMPNQQDFNKRMAQNVIREQRRRSIKLIVREDGSNQLSIETDHLGSRQSSGRFPLKEANNGPVFPLGSRQSSGVGSFSPAFPSSDYSPVFPISDQLGSGQSSATPTRFPTSEARPGIGRRQSSGVSSSSYNRRRFSRPLMSQRMIQLADDLSPGRRNQDASNAPNS